MLDLTKDIRSLTEFKRNTTELVDNLKRTKHPLVLTVNGKAELVVQDAQSYQELLEAAELIETLKGIKQGLEQMKAGQGKTAEDFFAEMFDHS
jgi:prevent-host-death family protein